MKIKKLIFCILILAISLILLMPTNVKAEVLQKIVIDDSTVVPVENEEPKFITLDGNEVYRIIYESWYSDTDSKMIIEQEENAVTGVLETKTYNTEGIKFERGKKYRYDFVGVLKDGYTVDDTTDKGVTTSTIDWDITAQFGGYINPDDYRGTLVTFSGYYTVPLFNMTLEATQGITITPSGTMGVQLNKEYVIDYTLEENYKLNSIKQTITRTDNSTEVSELKWKNYYYPQLQQLRLVYEKDSTIKSIKIEFIANKIATYDLIVENSEGVKLTPSGTISVKGDEIKTFEITVNTGYKLFSIEETITKMDDSIETMEMMLVSSQDKFNLYIPDDNTIKNMKIVPKAIKGITNAEELKAALGGDTVAKVEGNVVTLIKDVELEKLIYCVDGEYTLDLNGKKISSQSRHFMYLIEVTGTADLTIKDSDPEQKGEIYAGDLETIYVMGGTLRINGGTFTSDYGFGLAHDPESGNVIINGGTFNGDITAIGVYLGDDKNSSKGVLSLIDKNCYLEPSNVEVIELFAAGEYYSITGKSVTVKSKTVEDDEGPTGNTGNEDNNDTPGNTENEDNKDEIGNTDNENEDKNNTTENKPENKPENNTDAPQTGDNILLYVGMLVVSIMGILITVKLRKNYK